MRPWTRGRGTFACRSTTPTGTSPCTCVYGADSESVATAFLGDHPTCKVLFKSKDHYDYFSRALQHDDLCADHSGADCDKYEPDLEQLLWYDMEFSLNKEIL